MKLDKDTLLKKSVDDIINLCIKLNTDNEELRKKYNTLKTSKASEDVKETNKALREENRKLRAQIKAIQNTLNPQPKQQKKTTK